MRKKSHKQSELRLKCTYPTMPSADILRLDPARIEARGAKATAEAIVRAIKILENILSKLLREILLGKVYLLVKVIMMTWLSWAPRGPQQSPTPQTEVISINIERKVT